MKTPPEYGGLGLDTLNVTYAVEQIARIAPATAFVLLLHTLTANRIAEAGTEYQKRKYLPAHLLRNSGRVRLVGKRRRRGQKRPEHQSLSAKTASGT